MAADPWGVVSVEPERPPQPKPRSSTAATQLGGATAAPADLPQPRAPQAAAAAGAQASADPWAVQSQDPATGMDIGFIESAGRTAGAAAVPVVQTLGLAGASLLEPVVRVADIADSLAPLFGVKSDLRERVRGAQDRIFQAMQERVESMRGMYDPKPGEEFSTAGQLVGGVASMPIEMVGGMGLQRGIGRSADVLDAGGTGGDAALAGGVSGAANVVANLLPAKLGGAVGRTVEGALGAALPARAAAIGAGGATGGALGVAGDAGVVAAENASLPEGEQFQHLEGEINPASSGGLGAAFGLLAGAAGAPRPRAPKKAPAPRETSGRGSAGAAGADEVAERRERAAALPVPIALDEGQANKGNFEAAREIREGAKREGKAGDLLRDAAADQNERLLKNFEAFVDETGAERVEAEATGRAVVDPILEKARRAKQEINDAYKAAEDAGETAELVPYSVVTDYIAEKVPGERANSPVLNVVEQLLQRSDPKGTGEVSLKDLEEIRKKVRASTTFGTPDSVTGGEIIKLIDKATEAGGGDLYKAARQKYRDYAAEFKNQGAIRDLIALKKGTSDRKVAFEDVHRRVVAGGTLDDLRNVERTLKTAGPGGEQAWRELQGAAMRRIQEAATKNTSRDQRGNPIVSAAGLDRAIKALDSEGKLEVLFGKKGAEQLRDLNDIAKDVLVAPPGVVNTSSTAAVLAKIGADWAASTALTGVPLPILSLLKGANTLRKQRADVKRAKQLLGPRSDTLPKPPAPPGGRFATAPAPAPAPRAAAPAPVSRPPSKPVAKPEVRELGGREAELAKLRAQATDPQVQAYIDQQIEAERKRAGDRARGEEFLRLAEGTDDAALREQLETKAAGLGVKREPIPVGDARELGVERIDADVALADRVPAGEAAEVELDAATLQRIEQEWAEASGLSPGDLERARLVERAWLIDPSAVEVAAIQYAKSPVAFDRAIGSIIERGDPNARQQQGNPDRGEGSEPPEDGGEEPPRGPKPRGGGGSQGGGGGAAPAGGQAGGQAAAAAPPVARGDGEQRAASYLATRGDVDESVKAALLERFRDADRVLPAFDRAMHDAARAVGDGVAKVDVAPIKGPVRATEKVLAEYGGDASRIRDLVRGTIVVQKLGDVDKVVAALRGQFGEAIQPRMGLTPGSDAPTADGYRDFKANVMIDGHMAEVQVNVPEMLAAKKEAHPLYERASTIVRRAQEEGRNATPEEVAQVEALERRQREIYDAAWSTALRNAASSTRDPLLATDPYGNTRGSGLSQARMISPGSRETGTPSTRKNSVPAGKDLGSDIAAPPASILSQNPVGTETIVTTERGAKIPVRYVLADIGQLVTSHDDALKPNALYDQRLQPRDRSRQSSEEQVARMAADIRPELLGASAKASDGSPIVGADGQVESGNARTIALRRAYADGNAEGYRQWLLEHAADFGLTRAQVEGMRSPALVRQGLGDYDRAEFARQANEASVARLSTTEQAASDAQRMPELEGLVLDDDGNINRTQSADWIRDFVRLAVGPSERNAFMTAGGEPSQQGLQRIRNAVFQKAYGDAELVAMLTESPDSGVRNVLNGLLRAAGDVARVRDLQQSGARGGDDFVPDLVDAVRRYAKAREDGMRIDEVLAQQGMFGGEASPRVGEIMRGIEADARAPKRIGEAVRRMAMTIDAAGDPRQGMLMEPRARYLSDDLDRQQVFLTERARAAGHETLDAWVAADFDGFMRAADEWRERNPELELREPGPWGAIAQRLGLEDQGAAGEGRFSIDTGGLGVVDVRFTSREPLRAEIKATMGNHKAPAVTAEGEPAIRAAIEQASAGLREARTRMAAKVAAERSQPAPLLQAQTAADLAAKAEREAAAAKTEQTGKRKTELLLKKRDEAADIRARADATVDNFELGQSAQDQLAGQGSLFEQSAPYTVDLFGQPVTPPNPARKPRAAGGMAEAQGVAPPAGTYATRTAPVVTRQQKLGHAGPVRDLGDAANALSHLHRSAVERLDAVVTDKRGKPLGIIGGFKGALAQTSVYPSTLLGEALQIPGAADVWLVHNHPSGSTMLSRADEHMGREVARVFDGTGIRSRGIIAVGPKGWSGATPEGSHSSGIIAPADGPTVPAQEREITQTGQLGNGEALDSPARAKVAAVDAVRANGGRSVIILMDSQHRPTAMVPWAAEDALPLKGNGKLAALLRAAAHANAGAAIIATGSKEPMTLEQAQNIGSGLANMDVRVLDIIDPSGASAAERGQDTRAITLRAAALPTAGAALAGLAAAAQDDEDES